MTVPSIEDFDNATLNLQTIEEVSNVNYSQDTTTNRTGTVLDTLQGRLKKLGYEPPIAYAGAISFTVADNAKTIERNGLIYAPLASNLPFTTSGTWGGDDENDFLLLAQDLATFPAGIGLEYDNLYQKQNFWMARFKVDGTTGAISQTQKRGEFFGAPQVVTLSTFGPFQTAGFPSDNTMICTVEADGFGGGLSNAQFKAIPVDSNRVVEYQTSSINPVGNSASIVLRMYTQSGAPTKCDFFVEVFFQSVPQP